MHTELQKWSAGRLLILSCYCWQHCRSVMSGLTPESLERLKAVISMCVLLHSVLPLQLLLYLQPCFFFFFWHLADIKGQPILLVVLQWLYIDVCMFIWYVIFLSINLWLFQVTLLSWKLVYQRTLVRLLRQCFHIVLSSCSIWMCYNDSWAELKKKKNIKIVISQRVHWRCDETRSCFSVGSVDEPKEMQTQQPYSDAEQNNPNQERLEGESWLEYISTLEWLICNTTNPATRKKEIVFIFAAWHQAPKHYLSKLTIWWHWSTDSSAPLNFFYCFVCGV